MSGTQVTQPSLGPIAQYVRERGWRSIWMIDYCNDGNPLPQKGSTGYEGKDLPRPWNAETVSLGCPDGVAMFDVDQYEKKGHAKTGADQLKAMEARLGTLPETHKITCRGADDRGGKLLFRVPSGSVLRDPSPDVECIQRHWRFTWAPGTLHPGHGTPVVVYWRGQVCELPYVKDLPDMPGAWVEDLTRKIVRGAVLDVGIPDDGHTVCSWALSWFAQRDFTGTDPQGNRANKAASFLKQCAYEGHFVGEVIEKVRAALYDTSDDNWEDMWNRYPAHDTLFPDLACCGRGLFGNLTVDTGTGEVITQSGLLPAEFITHGNEAQKAGNYSG